jgi:hypothetical protein
VRLLQRSLDGDLPTLDEVREAGVEVPMPATHGGWLRLLAAGSAPKAEYWADLGRLHERLAASRDAGLLEAVLDLQARIEEAWNPDVLLVDARTGVTGLGGIATMALCDRVVLVTTRAKESLDGIRAVAESLRATPTLRGGERRLEFVVSRVQGTEAVDIRELREALGEYFELPHDRYDGGAERLLGAGPPSHPSWRVANRNFPDSLLARTLTWIATLFPTEADLANRARQRLVAVEEAWSELTDRSKRTGALPQQRWYWSPDMLVRNVEFSGSDGSQRTADIVATLDNGERALVIEFLDDQPGLDVARWWSQHTSAQVIVLQWYGANKWQIQRKMFLAGTIARDGDLKGSDRWGLPSPVEFEFLRDPTDCSVEVMLEAALRTRFYDDRLIVEWVHATPLCLHAVPAYWPEQARKIIDGLAAIEEVERAKEVLAACAENTLPRRYWLRTTDQHLDRLVQEGLCASLCWRAPPRAFIDLAKDHGHGGHGPPPAYYALRRLASFMGLEYDPDPVPFFRREAVELADADILVAGAVHTRELDFKWSPDHLPPLPPLAGSPPASERHPHPLAYHGHLGSYTPSTGRIVLAGPTIEAVAESLDRAPRNVGSVTLLHLSVLGMLHNGIDLDGQRWEGFPSGELSPVTVALAQFFVHRFLAELGDERLQNAFETLTDAQPPEYGAWRAMTHVSLEAGRAWMMAIRRSIGGPAPIDLDALLQPR